MSPVSLIGRLSRERRVTGLQKSLERLLKKFESDMQEEAIYHLCMKKNKAYLHIHRRCQKVYILVNEPGYRN